MTGFTGVEKAEGGSEAASLDHLPLTAVPAKGYGGFTLCTFVGEKKSHSTEINWSQSLEMPHNTHTHKTCLEILKMYFYV